MTQRKAIIILGASVSSELLIKKANKICDLIIVDKNEKAPGFEYAAERILVSTYNPSEIIEELIHLQESYNFIAVITRSSGIPVITLAKIAERFNLKAIGPISAQTIVHKNELMRLCNEKAISTPATTSTEMLENTDIEAIDFPVVIKPSMSVFGKKNVFLINNKEEFIEKFPLTKEASYSGLVNIEEYIDWDDVSFIGIQSKDDLLTLAIYDEINYFDSKNSITAFGLCIPSKYKDEENTEVITQFIKEIIKKLAINNTYFNICFKYKEGETPRLIEIHIDMGGDNLQDILIPKSSGYNLIDLYLEFLIEDKNPLEPLTYKPLLIIYKYDNSGKKTGEVKLVYSDSRTELEKIIQCEMEMGN